MYPVTTAGRIITCLSAYIGVVTCAILISVLVDHYQRVYKRKQFSPEQIVSAVSSSDPQENSEKQKFINRKLSGTKKYLASGVNLFDSMKPASFQPTIPHQNQPIASQYPCSSTYPRFIISFTDPKKEITDGLMRQLHEIIQITGDQIHLKLITTDSLPSIRRGADYKNNTVLNQDASILTG